MLWNYVKKDKKDNVMKNSYVMYQIREAVGRLQMFFETGVTEAAQV